MKGTRHLPSTLFSFDGMFSRVLFISAAFFFNVIRNKEIPFVSLCSVDLNDLYDRVAYICINLTSYVFDIDDTVSLVSFINCCAATLATGVCHAAMH